MVSSKKSPTPTAGIIEMTISSEKRVASLFWNLMSPPMISKTSFLKTTRVARAVAA